MKALKGPLEEVEEVEGAFGLLKRLKGPLAC